MEFKEIGYFLLGCLFLFIALKLWLNGDKIIESGNWFVGWASYMVCILLGFDSLYRSGISVVKYFM